MTAMTTATTPPNVSDLLLETAHRQHAEDFGLADCALPPHVNTSLLLAASNGHPAQQGCDISRAEIYKEMPSNSPWHGWHSYFLQSNFRKFSLSPSSNNHWPFQHVTLAPTVTAIFAKGQSACNTAAIL